MPDADLDRDIIENSLVGVYAIQDDRFVYVNRGMADMLGMTTEEMLELPSVMDIVVKADRPHVKEKMKGRLERGEDVAHYFFRMRHASGRRISVEEEQRAEQ